MNQDWAVTESGLIIPRHAVHRRPVAVDLFCGCGGMSLGFIQAGFEVVCGVDNDPLAAMTYMVNLGSYPIDIQFVEPEDRERFERCVNREMRRPEFGRTKKGASDIEAVEWTSGSGWIRHEDAPPVRHFILGDVRKVTGQQILDVIGLGRGEVDCVCGGPPCQGFSWSGRRNVMDPRNSLVFDFARLVLEIRPKTMVMENVPGLLSMTTPEGVPVLDALARILEDGGFGAFDSLKRSLLATSGAGAALKGKPVERGAKRRGPAASGETKKTQESSQTPLFEEVAI